MPVQTGSHTTLATQSPARSINTSTSFTNCSSVSQNYKTQYANLSSDRTFYIHLYKDATSSRLMLQNFQNVSLFSLTVKQYLYNSWTLLRKTSFPKKGSDKRCYKCLDKYKNTIHNHHSYLKHSTV